MSLAKKGWDRRKESGIKMKEGPEDDRYKARVDARKFVMGL